MADEAGPFIDSTGKPLVGRPTSIRPGACAVIFDGDGKILLERRSDNGFWGLPGGAVEVGESVEQAIKREVMEETGISLAEPTRHVATTNDVMVDDGKHYVTIFMLGEAPEDAEPQNLEPHKCKGWSWVSYAELRALPAERLFVPLINLLGDPSLCSTSFSL